MSEKKCPLCGCQSFYVKDPEDEYQTYAFDLKDGEVVFKEEGSAEELPAVDLDSVTYCERCSWHGEFKNLKRA
jgi:hypothetical protein